LPLGHSVNPSRIALLIETDGAGGAERMVAQLGIDLTRRGHSVVVYLPPRGTGWLGSQLQGSGVETDHFWLEKPLDPGCARELASSLRNRQIDIAHSHEFSLAFYGGWAARLAGIPHVITLHGHGYWAHALRRRLALRLAIRGSARTTAVSQSLARQAAKDLFLPQRQIEFLPNGVKLDAVENSSLRAELGLGEHQRLIVSVGSLYPVKGHRHLMEALALMSEHPELHYAIAGHGHLRKELEETARRLGVADRVHLLGLRPDVANVLAGADIFAMPSLAEGLPLALLEAMLASRPIVASEVGEIGQVLGQGKAGLLVPPGDPVALAGAIERLLENPAQARTMGEYAARRAEAEYGLERMTSRYEMIYEALLPARAGREAPELATIE
jgi:glycosyltransferase involved in cell wall biosynthesis